MSSKLINETTSMQLSALIIKVRKAKTAAEERAIIKKESANIRTALGQELNKYTKRNLIKLMYMRMLGYPSEFGQVPCLALITKGDYSEKRVGYLALMLLVDETHETLMMVTNSMKNDLNNFNDPWIIINALTALANICSPGMARDLASDIEQLADGTFLTGKGIIGAIAGHVRKKALLAATRMVTRAPELSETFKDLPGKSIQDGNHAVVMASVTLMLTIMGLEEEGEKMKQHYVTAPLSGSDKSYPHLLTTVLSRLHHSKFNHEYDVHGICNPFLQVKVLKCLGKLGQGNGSATETMTDILAKVAASHASVPVRTGRGGRSGHSTTSAAIGTEAASTIMVIEPVQTLRNYAVQIMANFLKQQDNNMRYVALNTLLYSATTDLSAVQRQRSMIVECVKDADTTIRRRALDLVYVLVNDSNVQALSKELLAYLAVTDDSFKASLTEHLCRVIQRHAPDTKWFIDNLLQVMVTAGQHVQDNVSRAFVVRVTNANESMQAYAARQSLRHLSDGLDTGSDLMLCTCMWIVGEYADLLDSGSGLLEGEDAWEAPAGVSPTVLKCLELLTKQDRSGEVHAYAVMAASKLIGRLPVDATPALQAILRKCKTDFDADVQQRSCELSAILDLKNGVPAALTERIPPLDEATYAGNLREDVSTIDAADKAAAENGQGDLLGDLLGDSGSLGDAAPGAASGAARSILDDLDDLLGGGAGSPPPPAGAPSLGNELDDLLGGAAESPGPTVLPPFQAWVSPEDGVSIEFTCSTGAPGHVDITATYKNSGSVPVAAFQVLAAVPKTMTVHMLPQQGGSRLAPGGANTLTQQMSCVNSTGGAKPLAMRLKVTYSVAATPREHLAVVSNFPPGL